MKGFLLLLAGALVAVLLMGGTVVTAGRSYDTEQSDAIVVLGAAQYWGDPSPVFENRLEHAAELYRQGVAPTVVTVGGGISGDKTTEAQAGAQFLEKYGVPESAVAVVAQGTDTVDSMEAVARRAEKQGWDSVTIVSDRDHVARGAAIARGLGFTAYTNAPAAGEGSKLTFDKVGRETMGLLRFYAWDRWHLHDQIN